MRWGEKEKGKRKEKGRKEEGKRREYLLEGTLESRVGFVN